MSDDNTPLSLSDNDIKRLAKEIVKQLFISVDISLGSGLRKKLVYIFIGVIIALGIALHVINIPGIDK